MIGNYLRSRRQELGLSFRQLSLTCGLSTTYLVSIECGKVDRLHPESAGKLLNALSVPHNKRLEIVEEWGRVDFDRAQAWHNVLSSNPQGEEVRE